MTFNAVDPREYPLAHNEMSMIYPHLLHDGRGTQPVLFTRVLNPIWTYPDGYSWLRALRDESKVGLHGALTPTWSETAWWSDYVLPMGLAGARHPHLRPHPRASLADRPRPGRVRAAADLPVPGRRPAAHSSSTVQTGELTRVETEIGYFVIKAFVTEGIRPGVVAASHHMGRWRLKEQTGMERWSSALVTMIEADDTVTFRQVTASGHGSLRTRRHQAAIFAGAERARSAQSRGLVPCQDVGTDDRRHGSGPNRSPGARRS